MPWSAVLRSALLWSAALLALAGCGSRTGVLPLDVDGDPSVLVDAAPPDAPPDAPPAETPPDAPPPLPPDSPYEPVRLVAAGLFHSCAATRAGGARCWGFNNQGQLGDGSRLTRWEPVSLGLADVVEISAGRAHGCARTEAGVVLCWGSHLRGQVGHGRAETAALLPTPVASDARFVQLDVGADHSCAVDEVGQVHCWGDNELGQVGPEDAARFDVPTRVPLPEPARAVSGGLRHSCALHPGGRVRCWGQASTAGRWDEDDAAPPFAPALVPGLPPVVRVDSGDSTSCGRTEGGEVWCWGFALAADRVARPTPATRVEGLGPVADLSVGHEFRCALRRDGRVLCWGNNARGQLGDGGAETDPTAFVAPVGLPASRAIFAGWRHACAVDASGLVRCWGRNWEGQLGDGRGGEHRLPTVAAVFRE